MARYNPMTDGLERISTMYDDPLHESSRRLEPLTNSIDLRTFNSVLLILVAGIGVCSLYDTYLAQKKPIEKNYQSSSQKEVKAP